MGHVLCFVAALLLAIPATAAKLPRSLCVEIPKFGLAMVLTLQRTGSVTTAAGKRTFHLIAGEVSFAPLSQSMPLAGSGHLAGDVLHFSLSGSDLRQSDDEFSANHYQGTWDLAQRTGTLSAFVLYENGEVQVIEGLEHPLAEIECTLVDSFY